VWWTGPWVSAFLNALGRDPDAIVRGLALLKLVYPVIGSIQSRSGVEPSGMAAAAQLEGMLRAALKEAGGSSAGREAETDEITLRFLLLLVRRGYFGRIEAIVEKIGEELEDLRGFLRVRLESPSPPEEDFKKDLEALLAGKTGAKGVVFEVKIVPELLGGYRLRIGTEIIDASLRALLKNMEADLAALDIPSRGGL
jgi:F-type H+-transporting ATPase subunit delta